MHVSLLACAADGQENNINDCIARIISEFGLTPEEQEQAITSGKQTVISNRIHWARTYLDKAGALVRTRRSHFRITDRGLSMLKEYPTRIDSKVLRQFPKFVAFAKPQPVANADSDPTTVPPADLGTPSTATPDESIDAAYADPDE